MGSKKGAKDYGIYFKNKNCYGEKYAFDECTNPIRSVTSTVLSDKGPVPCKTDTAIPHMSPKDILGYAFYMPTCAKEQQAIADILSAADKEIDLLEQELAQQEQKKKSLRQLLLTGIVRG